MLSIAQLWLPTVLSALGVFIASSIMHMALKFWHRPDYSGFSNEDEVRQAIRNGKPAPGMYILPNCPMENMQQPVSLEKFKVGPVGFFILRPNGAPNLGRSLLQWLAFCLVVSVFCAMVASTTLPPGAPPHLVFHTTALVALMGYAAGAFPMTIWWGRPWRATLKDAIDGLIHALVTGAIFMWLWPHA